MYVEKVVSDKITILYRMQQPALLSFISRIHYGGERGWITARYTIQYYYDERQAAGNIWQASVQNKWEI